MASLAGVSSGRPRSLCRGSPPSIRPLLLLRQRHLRPLGGWPQAGAYSSAPCGPLPACLFLSLLPACHVTLGGPVSVSSRRSPPSQSPCLLRLPCCWLAPVGLRHRLPAPDLLFWTHGQIFLGVRPGLLALQARACTSLGWQGRLLPEAAGRAVRSWQVVPGPAQGTFKSAWPLRNGRQDRSPAQAWCKS